jgi:hypothetical protein
MNRRKEVAIHEASHYALAKMLGVQVHDVEMRVTRENDTEDRFSGELIPVNFIDTFRGSTELKGSYLRKAVAARLIKIYSAGNIGAILYAGPDFWKINRNLFAEGSDFMMIRRLIDREGIPAKDLRTLFGIVVDYLSIPQVWTFINLIADALLKSGDPERPKKGFVLYEWEINKLTLKKGDKLIIPGYRADVLIEKVIGLIYFSSEKVAANAR